MSSTIKQAITALKSRIADAYTAISAKGGTLPAQETAANLPTAIASIPSAAGIELYLSSNISFRGSTREDLCETVIKQSRWNWDGGPFRDMTQAKKLDFTGLTITGVDSWYSRFVFYNSRKLESIDLRFVSIPMPTSSYNKEWFYYNLALKDIRVGSWAIYSINIGDAAGAMTRDSIVQFLTDLPTPADANQIITLGNAKLALLSDADKAIATSKGWTLA